MDQPITVATAILSVVGSVLGGLVVFLLGWTFYRIFSYFSGLSQNFVDLNHKIDLLAERMVTRDDLHTLKDEFDAVIIKLSAIEEGVDHEYECNRNY